MSEIVLVSAAVSRQRGLGWFWPPDVSPPGFEGFAPSPAAPAFAPGASYAAPLPLPPPRDESDATDDDDDAKDPCGALRYLGL